MPLVTMPDGQVVEMPDQLDPATAQRLRAFLQTRQPKQTPPVPPTVQGGISYLSDKLSGVTGAVRSAAEGVIEPTLTMATGAIAAPIAGFAGMAGDIYSGVTGSPRIGEEVASDVMGALTYQPRSESGRKNLSVVAQAFEGSKLAGLPIAGQELGLIAKAAPLDLAYQGSKLGTNLQTKATGVMQNALKPTPKQVMRGDAAIAAQQLLERDLSPNRAGIIALNKRIADLQDEIASTISGSEAQISKQKVLDNLVKTRDRFSRTATPQSDLAAIDKTAQQFSEHPLLPDENIPIQLAQDIKKGTYAELSGKYGELGSAETEAQKALARGLKEEIAAAEPSVAALNAEESALYKTLSVAERRMIADANKNPAQLVGAMRSPAMWGAYTANTSTAFKALLARLVYKAGKALKSMEPEASVTAPVIAPSQTAITPYRYTGEINPPEPPNWVPGSGYGPVVQEPQPMTQGLLGSTPLSDAERLAQNIRTRDRSTGIWQREQEAAAMAAEQNAPRQPASGGQLYDLDPITGRLRPVDQGLKGATPDTISSTGNYLRSASEKIGMGQAFRLSSEERVAWNKAKVELANVAPELSGLSDSAIAAKIADRQWVAARVEQLKTEYANWAKQASENFRKQRTAEINRVANEPRLMTSAEKAAAKSANSEAARRLNLTINKRKEAMQNQIDALEALSDSLAAARPIFTGSQGPKTRAAQRGMMTGAAE